jgi:hypothetical protein
VFVNFFATDMATNDDVVVSAYKSRQADSITAGLTPEHNPKMTAQLRGLADAIRRMPNQLFLQAFLTIDLVLKVIEDSTLYYVQRVPAELGSIAWVIDRKDRTITEMEDTWSTLVLPMSESHFAKTPLPCLIGADYSQFDEQSREFDPSTTDCESVENFVLLAFFGSPVCQLWVRFRIQSSARMVLISWVERLSRSRPRVRVPSLPPAFS